MWTRTGRGSPRGPRGPPPASSPRPPSASSQARHGERLRQSRGALGTGPRRRQADKRKSRGHCRRHGDRRCRALPSRARFRSRLACRGRIALAVCPTSPPRCCWSLPTTRGLRLPLGSTLHGKRLGSAGLTGTGRLWGLRLERSPCSKTRPLLSLTEEASGLRGPSSLIKSDGHRLQETPRLRAGPNGNFLSSYRTPDP